MALDGVETAPSSPTDVAPGRVGWRSRRTALRPPGYDGHQMLVALGFIALVAVVGPRLGTTRSNAFLVNLWLVYSITAVGFYWVFGLAGRFAFCQTFMMAMGGYTSAYVTRGGDGRPFWLGLLCALVVTTVIALVVGILLARTHELYFGIATLALTQIGLQFFHRAEWFTGPSGTTSGVPVPELFGRRFVQDSEIFWLFLGILGVILVLGVLIERSPIRREALAAQENAPVVALSGVPVVRLQVALFMLGSAMGGLSGALIAHWNGVISTESFGIDLAIGIFLMLILGGVRSMWGPVLGAAFYVAVPRVFSGLERYQTIAYGALLLVVIIAAPRGLVGGLQALGARLRGMRRSEPVDAAG